MACSARAVVRKTGALVKFLSELRTKRRIRYDTVTGVIGSMKMIAGGEKRLVTTLFALESCKAEAAKVFSHSSNLIF